VAEYCRRHGLCSKTAWVWAKRLRSEKTAVADTLELVPVKLPAQLELPGLPRLASRAERDSGIRLEFGTMNVSLSVDFDVEALRRILAVLEAR